MTPRYGRCRNQDYCSLAVQGTVLRLDDGELFVCPECSRPLSPTGGWQKGSRGRVAFRRLIGPLALVVLGTAVMVQGLRHSEPPPKPALNQPAKPAVAPAHLPIIKAAATPKPAAPARPKPAAPARPKPPPVPPPPPPETIVLRVDAYPPLNTMLLPQLAAGFLTFGREDPATITTVGDRIRVALATDGPTLVILVREAPFDAAAMAVGQTDIACTPNLPSAGEQQQAGPLMQVAAGAMPTDTHPSIACYAKVAGRAADFAAFLTTPEAAQIIANAGYQPPPPPPPPPPVPAPKPAAAVPKPAVPVAKPKPAAPVAKAAPPTATADADTAGDQPHPRIVHVAPGSGMTMEALKAMTTPDQPSATPSGESDPVPKPRRIYLPADARLTYGTYTGVKIPETPTKLFFVNPNATRQPGSLKADCKISTDGIPTDCKELSHQGTPEAAAAILAWLPSGAIRYAPVIKNGHAVTDRRVLTVNFGGPKPDEKK
jgi:hypothetical protein